MVEVIRMQPIVEVLDLIVVGTGIIVEDMGILVEGSTDVGIHLLNVKNVLKPTLSALIVQYVVPLIINETFVQKTCDH